MSMHRRLILVLAAQVVGVLVVGAVALQAQARLGAALRATGVQFDVIRAAHRVGHHLAMARLLARRDADSFDEALRQAEAALQIWDPPVTARADRPDAAQNAALLATLRACAVAETPERMVALATTGVAEVQRVTQAIEGDVRARQAEASALQTTATWRIGAVGAAAALATAALGVAQRRSVVRPLASLRRGMDRLRRREFSTPVEERGDTEFREIANYFNTMSQELRAAHELLESRVEQRTAQLIRSDRQAAIGVLAAGFAHEVNNPLAIIRAHAEHAMRRDESGRGEAHDALRVVIEEVDRARRVIDQLQSLGSEPAPTTAPTTLDDVVRRAIDLVQPVARRAACGLERRAAADDASTTANANAEELVQVLVNLLLNAIEASAPGGVVRIETAREGDLVTVRVADRGVGMSRVEADRAFEPFISGKGRTGLGLTVSRAIAERYEGRLDAQSEGPGAGAVFTLTLPARNPRGTAS